MKLKIKIQEARDLRKLDKGQDALDILLPAHQEHPLDPDLNYQIAWTYDSLGQEGKAVPFYEAALVNGLVDDRRGAFLGLGSTYRCLGDYQKSLTVFDRAIGEFPDDRALQVFRALTLYNLGVYDKSVEVLLTQLLDTTNDADIKSYDRALRFYKDKLDDKWK